MKSRKHLSKVVVRVEEPGPNRNASTICRAAILLLVSFAFGLAAPSRGYAAVRTVCASGCKYTTIAAAIAAARPGSTISILDAVHVESNITPKPERPSRSPLKGPKSILLKALDVMDQIGNSGFRFRFGSTLGRIFRLSEIYAPQRHV